MKKSLQFIIILILFFYLPTGSFGFDHIDETNGLNAVNLKINFQDQASTPPSGWLKDYGQPFGTRPGSTNNYGWKRRSDGSLLDLSTGGTAGNGRKRNTPADILLATFMHMQGNDVVSFNGTPIEGIWEMAVDNGIYLVSVSVGDGVEINSEHSINVEGVSAINKFIPAINSRFKNAALTVTVADGHLTIDAIGGINTKINTVTVESVNEARPSILGTNPENNAENVNITTSISTSVLNLPHGAIDNSTISTTHVYLEEVANGVKIPSNVNGTGGGDAITLVPSSSLKINTQYKFTVTDGVKDVEGFSFLPYSMTFKTGSSTVGQIENVQFEKTKQATSDNVKHTTLAMGPDGKLYGSTIDGAIRRYPVAADGSLGTPEIFLLKNIYNDTKERAIIGLTFDPSATAENLIVYITHSSYLLENAPNWDGKITRLSGPNLQTLQDIVINLPRSTKDHLTNSLEFGPDGAIYINQGSTSAMGAADPNWDMRPETLLSGSLLRLDLTKLTTLPLDVKTSEGGNYNPYAANAPLTLYATGVRNAYDLVWHSNGQLYVPTNGSAPGGNSPASVNGTLRPDGTTYNGPSVPALNNINQVMDDFLFRVEQGGYYGHPNPLRGEYVLNGGNPTAGNDPAQINAYPVGTLPDANYRGFAFNFSINKSANGVIEYKSNAFKGFLKGKLLVVRFSQNKDIITLTPGGPNLDITSAIEGPSIPGFSGFIDPLDLIEDTRNGNIYVSEYIRNEEGKGYITLLKPIETIVNKAPTISEIADQIITVGENVDLISFTLGDEDDDVNGLQLSAKSDNHELVLDDAIAIGGSGAERTLTITPSEGQAGTAVITLTVTDGYDETETSFSLKVEEITSIEDELTKNSVVLYPNPTSSNIDLIIKNAVFGEVNIQVLDLRGRVYKSFTYNKQEEKMQLQLDLHELAKGSYIVQVKQNGPVSSKVIIKL